MSTFIVRRISVPPKLLDYNIKKSIITIAKNLCKKQCSNKEGYILKVQKIHRILDNKVSINGDTIFKVEFEADVLKPQKDKIYKGIVCMIFEYGMLVEIKSIMKVLIPMEKLDGFTLSDNNSSLTKEKIEITKGNEVNIEIYDFKYSKHNFNCLGILKV